eukprot:GHVR01068639.1.p1 GENE.GHVR01068639.1~~GHVR01068639.1.p1  ORF type:complete len:245 (-),score=54.27 GHVR01068639.1:79-813(-)
MKISREDTPPSGKEHNYYEEHSTATDTAYLSPNNNKKEFRFVDDDEHDIGGHDKSQNLINIKLSDELHHLDVEYIEPLDDDITVRELVEHIMSAASPNFHSEIVTKKVVRRICVPVCRPREFEQVFLDARDVVLVLMREIDFWKTKDATSVLLALMEKKASFLTCSLQKTSFPHISMSDSIQRCLHAVRPRHNNEKDLCDAWVVGVTSKGDLVGRLAVLQLLRLPRSTNILKNLKLCYSLVHVM